jgi:enoyl-CoA hydratase/carnithine racemase
MLPRIIGQGRASELLYTGRVMTAEEGRDWGFFNGLADPGKVLELAMSSAQRLSTGPTFAHGVTKKCLHQEWNVSIEQALEIEAEAQAICMQTQDFTRAYNAFVAKEKPVFEGN